MDGLCPIDDVVTLDGQAGGGQGVCGRGKGVARGGAGDEVVW